MSNVIDLQQERIRRNRLYIKEGDYIEIDDRMGMMHQCGKVSEIYDIMRNAQVAYCDLSVESRDNFIIVLDGYWQIAATIARQRPCPPPSAPPASPGSAAGVAEYGVYFSPATTPPPPRLAQ